MVPDACGLARATRALFRSHRRKLNEYAGAAMSYQVLEEWAMLGIGAAILPRSRVSEKAAHALPITDKNGEDVTIAFEAAWPRSGPKPPHLLEFAEHLRHIAPAVVAGLESGGRSRA
jgi:DNA-binding transcriptional LysR family regulator